MLKATDALAIGQRVQLNGRVYFESAEKVFKYIYSKLDKAFQNE